jgi:hypothetical protein
VYDFFLQIPAFFRQFASLVLAILFECLAQHRSITQPCGAVNCQDHILEAVRKYEVPYGVPVLLLHTVHAAIRQMCS